MPDRNRETDSSSPEYIERIISDRLDKAFCGLTRPDPDMEEQDEYAIRRNLAALDPRSLAEVLNLVAEALETSAGEIKTNSESNGTLGEDAMATGVDTSLSASAKAICSFQLKVSGIKY